MDNEKKWQEITNGLLNNANSKEENKLFSLFFRKPPNMDIKTHILVLRDLLSRVSLV